MNLAKFKISVSEIENVLKRANLFKMKGVKILNQDGVSDEFKEASQNKSYLKTHFIGLEKYDFDFLLSDQSFLQFEFKEGKDCLEIRYAFFQNPMNYKTYTEFIQEQINIGTIDVSVEEVGDLLFDEYGQFLNEQDFNAHYSTMRYDSDFSNYRPLIHSVSHIHIGHDNNIRIPVNKFISPLMFVLFVIKHVYYNNWQQLFTQDEDYLKKLLNQSHDGMLDLKADKWNQTEELELFLT